MRVNPYGLYGWLKRLNPIYLNGSMFGATQAYYKLCGLAIHLLMAHLLPADAIGIYLFSFAIALSLSVLIGMGSCGVVIRQISREPARTRELIAPALGLRLLGLCIYIVVITITVMIIRPDLIWIALLAALVVFLQDLYDIFGGMLIARGQVMTNIRVGLFSQTFSILLLVPMVWYTRSILAIIAADLVRNVIALTGIYIASRRLEGEFYWKLKGSLSLFREALPFLVIEAISILRNSANSIMVGMYLSFEAVTHLGFAGRLAEGTTFAAISFSILLYPKMSALQDGKNRKQLAVKSGLISFGLGVLVILLTPIVIEPLISIMYGSVSVRIIPIFRLLSLSFPFWYAAIVFASMTKAIDLEKEVAGVTTALAVLGVIATVLVVPVFGVKGAAIICVCGSILFFVALIWLFFNNYDSNVHKVKTCSNLKPL